MSKKNAFYVITGVCQFINKRSLWFLSKLRAFLCFMLCFYIVFLCTYICTYNHNFIFTLSFLNSAGLYNFAGIVISKAFNIMAKSSSLILLNL